MRFWAINDLVRLPYLLAHNGPHLVLMVDVFVVRVYGTPFAYFKTKGRDQHLRKVQHENL